MTHSIVDLALAAGMERDGDNFFSPSHEEMDVHISDLERFARLVEKRKCEELAKKIEAMPFGDTAASFAAWVREQ